MSDFGEILGTIMSSIARARQMADEQTALIAEQYSKNPLLEGLSVPRIRLPEVTIDLPMLIDSHEEGTGPVLEEPDKIHSAVVTELKRTAKNSGVTLKAGEVNDFSARFKASLKQIEKAKKVASLDSETGTLKNKQVSGHTELVRRAMDQALLRSIGGRPNIESSIPNEKQQEMLQALAEKVESIVERAPARAPSLTAVTATHIVKERSSPENVTRVKVTIREEGLEWSVGQGADNTVRKQLSPE